MRIAAMFVTLTFGSGVTAGDAPTPAERLQAVRESVDAAEKHYHKAAEALGDTEADQKKAAQLFKAFDTAQEAGFVAALELAKADPKSDAGFDALDWLVSTPRAHYKPVGKPALEMMAKYHAADRRVGRPVAVVAALCPPEKSPPHDAAVGLLDAVARTNPDRTVQGQAYFGLALLAKRSFAVAEYRGLPTEDALAAEAERQFARLARDFGDCRDLRRSDARLQTVTLGDRAKAELFDLQHLRVGKSAPEIAGEDLAGVPLKLSDSRGRVTLLVFWASWCGPCMEAVAHEKKIAERFQGRPFTLVGVNGDDDPAAAAKAVEKAGISWRSFRDAKPAGGPPISAQYNLGGWPTLYVLDRHGVIRAKDVYRDALDEVLEELVAETEAAK